MTYQTIESKAIFGMIFTIDRLIQACVTRWWANQMAGDVVHPWWIHFFNFIPSTSDLELYTPKDTRKEHTKPTQVPIDCSRLKEARIRKPLKRNDELHYIVLAKMDILKLWTHCLIHKVSIWMQPMKMVGLHITHCLIHKVSIWMRPMSMVGLITLSHYSPSTFVQCPSSKWKS